MISFDLTCRCEGDYSLLYFLASSALSWLGQAGVFALICCVAMLVLPRAPRAEIMSHIANSVTAPAHPLDSNLAIGLVPMTECYPTSISKPIRIFYNTPNIQSQIFPTKFDKIVVVDIDALKSLHLRLRRNNVRTFFDRIFINRKNFAQFIFIELMINNPSYVMSRYVPRILYNYFGYRRSSRNVFDTTRVNSNVGTLYRSRDIYHALHVPGVSGGRQPESSCKSGDSEGSKSRPSLWWERVKSIDPRDYKAIAGGAVIVVGLYTIAFIWGEVLRETWRKK
jgi:hypothetical protein